MGGASDANQRCDTAGPRRPRRPGVREVRFQRRQPPLGRRRRHAPTLGWLFLDVPQRTASRARAEEASDHEVVGEHQPQQQGHELEAESPGDGGQEKAPEAEHEAHEAPQHPLGRVAHHGREELHRPHALQRPQSDTLPQSEQQDVRDRDPRVLDRKEDEQVESESAHPSAERLEDATVDTIVEGHEDEEDGDDRRHDQRMSRSSAVSVLCAPSVPNR